jgi:hypothetical protein
MKKINLILTIVLLITSFSISAQTKSEKKAKKISDEITAVLSLDKAKSETIYTIQLARFEEATTIKKEFKNQTEVKKEKLKKLGSKIYNGMKKALGKDQLKKWRNHKSKK